MIDDEASTLPGTARPSGGGPKVSLPRSVALDPHSRQGSHADGVLSPAAQSETVHGEEPDVAAGPAPPTAERVTEVGRAEVVDRRRHWLAMSIGVLGVFSALVYSVVVNTRPLADRATDVGSLAVVELPDLRGESVADASARLEALGLVVDVTYGPNETLAVGTVFDTDPVEGAKMYEGDPVMLTVSDGPAGFTVPKVAGLQQFDATNVLVGAKLQVKVVPVPNETVRIGEVVATNPDAGERAVEGQTVDLEVSSGPAPRTVPDLVNRQLNDGLVELGRAGLGVGEIDAEARDGVADGTILAIDPASGSKVPRQTPVNLVVAGEDRSVTVPFVTGLSVDAAQEVLESVGLEVTVSAAAVGAGSPLAGIVINQDPAPSSKVSRRGTVTLEVGSG